VAQLFIQDGGGFERSHTFEAEHSLSLTFVDMNEDDKADWVITADENAATRLFVSSGDVVETVVTSSAPEVEPEVETVVTVVVVEETSTGVVVVKSGSLGSALILLALLLIVTRRPVLRGQAIPLKR
jgi:hypothetical protein